MRFIATSIVNTTMKERKLTVAKLDFYNKREIALIEQSHHMQTILAIVVYSVYLSLLFILLLVILRTKEIKYKNHNLFVCESTLLKECN